MTEEEKLGFDPAVLEAVLADAQPVQYEQMRNSILQVAHRWGAGQVGLIRDGLQPMRALGFFVGEQVQVLRGATGALARRAASEAYSDVVRRQAKVPAPRTVRRKKAKRAERKSKRAVKA